MTVLAFALFLWSWKAIANWDGDDTTDMPVDDMPDVPPQLGR